MTEIPAFPPYPMITPGMTQAEHYDRMVYWIVEANKTIAAINETLRGSA
jgi:hypothetical protein